MDHSSKMAVSSSISMVIALLVSFSAAQGVQTTPNPDMNPCQNFTCAANEVCRLVEVQCFRAPCYPVPECAPACSPLTDCAIRCTNGLAKDANGCATCQCRVCGPDPCAGMICFYGKAKDDDGCVLCPCNQPCMDVECPSGTECQEQKDATSDTYSGICVATVSKPPCPQVRCTNTCQFYYKWDSNGCQTCDCYDPCQSYHCPDGKRCVLSADDCEPGAECRDAPMPYCTDASTVSIPTSSKAPGLIGSGVTCSPLTGCSLNCSSGFVKDADGCATCRCSVCGPDPCAGNICFYGRMTDADGCVLCPCNEPCSGVNCSADEVCQVSELAAATNAYVGECVPRVSCPQVRCSNVCRFFYKYDSNGCQTCSCYDPCETYPCLATERCVLTADDCPAGAECRDAPMPICVAMTNSSTTLTVSTTSRPAGRGEDVLLQCCIEARISDGCLPFCTRNITQLFQNYESLTVCYRYLGNFLSCASGGRSFETCCRNRGISELCVGMCSGDDQIDTSNPHQVNQCILTSSQTVMDCFNDGLPDNNTSVTVTVVTPSSSAAPLPGFCAMAADTGPCRASVDRWYYSANDRACATFTYGGCQGNGNNFATKEACLATCGGRGPVCPEVMCETHCQVTVDPYGCHTCSCASDCFTQGCPGNQMCMMTSGRCASNATNCPMTPSCVSPPDTICNTTNCTLSCPNGWMTDSQGCAVCQCRPPCDVMCTMDPICPFGRAKGSDGCDVCSCYEPCQGIGCPGGCRVVKDDSRNLYYGECYDLPAFCHLASDYGMSCRDQNVTRWFFDATVNRCIQFQFGGCLGNDNNFQSTEICESVCVTGAPPTVCPPLACDVLPICDYGLKPGVDGCMTCECLDPCEGMACPDGQTCVSRKCADNERCMAPYLRQCLEATSTTSTTPATTSKRFDGCPQVMCTVYCSLGFVKDGNGCDTCKCNDPCKNCTANQTCVTMDVDCPPFAAAPCAYSMIGYCVDSTRSTSLSTVAPPAVTTSAIRCLLCAMRCTYGMLKDSRGCTICSCYNPCGDMNCANNATCLVSEACGPAEDCAPNIRYKGKCPADIVVSTTTTTTPLSTASPSGRTTPKLCMMCLIFCSYGMEMGSNGCPSCKCRQPCMNVTCTSGEECRVAAQIDGQFVGQCVALTTTTTTTTAAASTTTKVTTPRPCIVCAIYCPYGNEMGSDGCPACKCKEPCMSVTCPAGTVCRSVASTERPTIFVAQCVAQSTTPATTLSPTTTTTAAAKRCDATPPSCELLCPYNYGTDSNGCRTCQCRDPCQMSTTCDPNICVRISDGNVCQGDYCWPTYRAVCGGACQTVVGCGLNCTYGYDTDAMGCNVCRCRNPCQDFACPMNYECSVKNVNSCLSGVCRTVPAGYCAAACPSMTSCNLTCLYGQAMDAFGCKTCQCLDPCEGTVCRPDQTCVVADPPVVLENPPGFTYTSRCEICGQTRTCKMNCANGFQKDSLGCEMCQCYDPCQNVTCPENQRCAPKEQFNGRYKFIPQCTAMPSGTTFLPPITNPGSSTTKMMCAMPMCFGPRCTFGLGTDVNGCTTCNCAPDPCQGRSCSNMNEVCQALIYCPSGNCRPYQTVCISKLRPCEALQAEYRKLFADDDAAKMPQLNCDSNGQFKLTQCQGADCWCVDGAGAASPNKSDANVNCYNGDPILQEAVKIDADFDMIKPDEGWKFKQQLSEQLANLLAVDESLVTIMKYERGSIVASVLIATDAQTTTDVVQARLTAAKLRALSFPYANGTYPYVFVADSSATSPPAVELTLGPVLPNRPPPSDQLLMIILVCVLVPIGFIATAATVWLACKTCRHQDMIPAKPLKSGLSTDVCSVEGGSEKSYASSDYPTADTKPVLRVDTTEA